MSRQRQIDDAFEQVVRQTIAVRRGEAAAESTNGAFNKYVLLSGATHELATERIDAAIEQRFGGSPPNS